MNIYACYRNTEGNWVVDGEKGREVYPPRFDKVTVKAIYKGEMFAYECGKYNITVWEHDIRCKDSDIALVQIDRFDEEDSPIDKKHFYLPDGKQFDVNLTEADIDKLYARKVGSWL